MASRIRIIYGGNEYISTASDLTAEAMKNYVDNTIGGLAEVNMELEDGRFLVAGKGVIENAIFIFEEM